MNDPAKTEFYIHNNIVYEENGYEICDVFDKKAAPLIVKSPELYAMLKEIVECGLIAPTKENVIQAIKELLKEAGGGESEHRTSNVKKRESGFAFSYAETRKRIRDRMAEKTILDACCGSRMFWFDRNNENTVYMDNREVDTKLCDGRKLTINPDIVADFTNMPFDDETFNLVVFDPPHLVNAGEKSWLATKYGKLNKDWKDELKQGFNECFRVLKNNGVLIFKWNEDQVKISEVIKLSPVNPLFGNRRAKTHWMVFMKIKQTNSPRLTANG